MAIGRTSVRVLFLFALGAAVLPASLAGAQEAVKTTDKLRPLDHPQVEVGGEMGRRIKITVENSLLNLDIDGQFLKPFIEKQTKKGSYQGLGLLLDATVRFAAYTRDERVIKLKRHLVSKLIAAQTADGYLGEFVPAQRIWEWIDIQELAYLMNGLLSDYHFFKEEGSLAAARKQADHILARWDGKPNDWPEKWGSLHMVTTGLDRFMFLLSEVTGDARYRDFCIKKLGVTEWNDGITLGRWGRYEGHVYGYLARCLAQLDWYRREPKESLLVPTRRAVDFMLEGDGMVITGICGDWECWHDTQAGTINLAETCSTTYVLKMMDSLLRLNGDSVYGDVMERTILNGLFGAQSPDGRRIRYFTAFEGPRIYWTGLADIGRPPKPRQPPTPAELMRGDTFCCPNNYRRAISDLPALIYYRTSEDVAVNLFTESSATVELREGVKVSIKQETDYPNSGNVKLHLEPSRPCEFALQLRIPRWCLKAEIRVNGKLVEGPIPSGAFFTLRETWKPGDQVELSLPMSWRFIKGRQSQGGRVAIVRGPMIYSLNPARHKELQGVDLRLLTLNPSSLEGPFPDGTVRPNGLACKVRAWRPGVAYPDAKTDYQLVLTEYPDPDGEAIYFGVPNPNAKEFVADELMVHPDGHFLWEGSSVTVTDEELGGRMFCQMLLPAKREVRLLGGENHEFEVNGQNPGPTAETYRLPKGSPELRPSRALGEGVRGWRIEVEDRTGARTVRFLHVFQTSTRGVAAMAPCEVVTSEGMTGATVKLAGRTTTVLFRDSGPTGGKIAIEGPGNKKPARSLATKIQDNYDNWKEHPDYAKWMSDPFRRSVILGK